MNISALCALLAIACGSPVKPTHYEILGMVAGRARQIMEADWDSTADDPTQPERAYEVLKDSIGVWRTGQGDTLIVLFVLDVVRIPPKRATVVSFSPSYVPKGPTIHTHQNYCDITRWGPDYGSCSGDRPESNQCRPSIVDQHTQILEGHPYDFIQCGRSSWVLYVNPDIPGVQS